MHLAAEAKVVAPEQVQERGQQTPHPRVLVDHVDQSQFKSILMGCRNALSRSPEFLSVNTPNYMAAPMARCFTSKPVDRQRVAVVVAAPVVEMNCGDIACAINDQVHLCPLLRLTK